MKTPIIRRFERVLFCEIHREACNKINKTKKGCNNICSQCDNSEQIYQRRNT